MNSLHINHWTHLNLDLTCGHLNTFPWTNTFFSGRSMPSTYSHIFQYNFRWQMTWSFWRKTEIRIMWTNKPYHAAKNTDRIQKIRNGNLKITSHSFRFTDFYFQNQHPCITGTNYTQTNDAGCEVLVLKTTRNTFHFGHPTIQFICILLPSAGVSLNSKVFYR